MAQVLSLSFRPKTMDAMVGQKKLVNVLRGHFKQDRMPQAYMFVGETGAGKTTLARILAVALQCTHQDAFGNPCKACYKNRKRFDISEINISDLTGVDDLRKALEGSDYVPRPGSRARVYILDEAQMATKNAQNLLLKFFEDCPATTYWIICTTDPHKILQTLQSRCQLYTVKSLDLDGVNTLVKRGLKKVNSELASEPLSEALYEKGVTSPRKVLNAVEKYVAGAEPEAAAEVDLGAKIDTYRLCRNLIKGNWVGVSKLLKQAKDEDAYGVRSSVAAYLRSILLDYDFSSRATVLANGLEQLSTLGAQGDSLQLSGTVACLFNLCKTFKNYKR